MPTPVKFLPPIIALLVVAAWLGARHHSIRSEEKEVAGLEQRIRAAGTTAVDPAADPSLASRVRSQRDASLAGSQPLDWKQIAARFARSPESRLDMRSFAGLQQRVMEMSATELLAALDEIEGLQLPVEIGDQLEGMLIGQLAKKAPQQALERYGDHIGSNRGHITWPLTDAISRWAGDDPVAAGKWLDGKIEAGLFDSTSLTGRNQDRIRFEAAMVGALLSGSPAAAAHRLQALPESQRAEILRQHWLLKLDPEEHQAFADLARRTLPADQQADTLAHTASSLGGGSEGLQRVTGFLQHIDPAPGERSAIAARIARNELSRALNQDAPPTGQVDQLHDWLVEQVPAEADSLTGTQLSQAGGDVERKAAVVAGLHDRTGSDALLLSFLDNEASINAGDAYQPLIDKIADPQRREEIRSKYAAASAARQEPATPDPAPVVPR